MTPASEPQGQSALSPSPSKPHCSAVPAPPGSAARAGQTNVRFDPEVTDQHSMATILGNRRTQLVHTIERLREQRAQIDEKLGKLEQEPEDFVPATDEE